MTTAEKIFDSLASAVLTKSGAGDASDAIAVAAMDGEISPLETVVRLGHAADVIEQARKAIMPCAVEALRADGGEATVLGVKLTESEVGVSYDYAKDPMWREIKDREAAVVQERKTREEWLRGLKSPVLVNVLNESVEVAPPAKKWTDSVRASFPA